MSHQSHYFITQDPSTLPRKFTVNRHNHEATWWEVKDYKLQLLATGDHSRPLPLHVPDRCRTDTYPLIPEVWHAFCEPFSIIHSHPLRSQYLLIHTDLGLPVAIKNTPKLFKTSVEALIAANDISVLNDISRTDLVRQVEDLMEVWFMDGEVLAEYCLTFKDVLFYDVPYRNFPHLVSY
ncbi:hypothetical protein PQX77_013891 [Marasmius sp. AFHP31]|nr:hypothetical protein PQX77_013891 [Marasmius sp. AFHP31]